MYKHGMKRPQTWKTAPRVGDLRQQLFLFTNLQFGKKLARKAYLCFIQHQVGSSAKG